MRKCANAQMRKCANAQMCKCANAQMRKCELRSCQEKCKDQGKFCERHTCTYPGCLRRRKYQGSCSEKHGCAVRTCPRHISVPPGYPILGHYCPEHRCMKCTRKPVESNSGILLCKIHIKCKIKNCEEMKIPGKKYCGRHICSFFNCEEKNQIEWTENWLNEYYKLCPNHFGKCAANNTYRKNNYFHIIPHSTYIFLFLRFHVGKDVAHYILKEHLLSKKIFY
jgi:hypothetical protein